VQADRLAARNSGMRLVCHWLNRNFRTVAAEKMESIDMLFMTIIKTIQLYWWFVLLSPRLHI
jgi:hypothetical protein